MSDHTQSDDMDAVKAMARYLARIQNGAPANIEEYVKVLDGVARPRGMKISALISGWNDEP